MPDKGLNNSISEILKTSVEFELPKGILESVKLEAKKTGDTVENIISKGLGAFLKDKFIEEERQKEIGDIIGDLSIKELESEVLFFMNQKPSEFAHGSEGQVFKMHIPGKDNDVMIVKRPYKETGKKEYDLHKKAKDIEILFNKENESNSVKIPSIFHHFNDGVDDYVVMEYIQGKTLYNMIIEEILSNETFSLGKKIKDDKLRKLFYYHYYYLLEDKKIGDIDMDDFYSLSYDDILELLSNEEGFLKKINLEGDTNAENKFKELYILLKEAGVEFEGDPKAIFDLDGDPVNKMIYDKVNHNDFKKLGFLSNVQVLHLKNNLNKFLGYMHKNGFYHMDIGSNTRNIIFTEDNGLYIPNIIDFGKSKFYDDKYVPTDLEKSDDFFIITNYIEKLGFDDKNKDKIIDNLINTLCEIGTKFSMTNEDIITNYNYYKRYSDIEYFNDLKKVLFTGEIPGNVKLDLGKNGEIKYNNMIFSKILILMYFTREENFSLIGDYLDKLEDDKSFKISFKKKVINMYKEIYQEVTEIRKNQD